MVAVPDEAVFRFFPIFFAWFSIRFLFVFSLCFALLYNFFFVFFCHQNPPKQKKISLPCDVLQALMRAAGYGKSFLSDYDSDEFVECCRKLRVLNNCRHKAAGMPITSHQYDRLTPEVSYDF